MKKAKMKICGITQMSEIMDANKYRPDYIGFVFADGRHKISIESAIKMRNILNKDIKIVGVFVNEDITVIKDIIDRQTIDLIQLHGQEDDQYISRLKKETNKKIIKAFSIHSEMDIKRAEKSFADYILYDNNGGGSGQTFDWNLLDGCKRKYFLAGGINCKNITRALMYGPYAIDLSSGVETDGKKDINKIYEILEATY